ncbi:MAG: septum formation initiator family protein [Minisyncoccia bacterium]
MQSKIALFLLGVLIIVFSWSIIQLIGKMQDTNKNKKIAENKISELQKQKEKLIYDITNLNTDKGKEENIRERFGFAKEGEEMIVVVDDKNLLDLGKETKTKGFFSFIKNLFN